ncbi:hypothetical protein H6G33_10065 [Calothrix sp. FACHB-1219]|uniref:hypothetical protein n=1 Tax=unclassified Calothrix TaxID=2619626 RepID=UPI0016895F1D|nr:MULTISPECIES: hypothetical protein [unclassified Calothrix]MBD2201692.1 hypothetical protein [Calothrix sp. FACHB-168]MBD2217378.1 hypothetical protein [Calothrix sp. FACHB-1219]
MTKDRAGGYSLRKQMMEMDSKDLLNLIIDIAEEKEGLLIELTEGLVEEVERDREKEMEAA